MTYTVEERDTENFGSQHAEVLDLNVTSLDAAGTENLDLAGEARSITRLVAGSVLSQEDESLAIEYDHVAGAITVQNIADGTDAAAGTDIGRVKVLVLGS